MMRMDENVIPHEPADNQEVFNSLGALGSSVLLSIVHSVNLAPFTSDAVKQCNLNLDGLVLAVLICNLGIQEPRLRRQQAILEVISPCLPRSMVLDTTDAHAELAHILADEKNLKDQEWFTDGTRELQRMVITLLQGSNQVLEL